MPTATAKAKLKISVRDTLKSSLLFHKSGDDRRDKNHANGSGESLPHEREKHCLAH
jgi:hypothetical protein